MSDFTHSLFSHGNKALSIGDSKPLRYRGVFFWISCIYLYQKVQWTSEKVALISKVFMTNRGVNFVMRSLHVW